MKENFIYYIKRAEEDWLNIINLIMEVGIIVLVYVTIPIWIVPCVIYRRRKHDRS